MEIQLGEDNKLILEDLPFQSGERVEVIILSQSDKDSYPLRGKSVNYIEPTKPVAVDDWVNLITWECSSIYN